MFKHITLFNFVKITIVAYVTDAHRSINKFKFVQKVFNLDQTKKNFSHKKYNFIRKQRIKKEISMRELRTKKRGRKLRLLTVTSKYRK